MTAAIYRYGMPPGCAALTALLNEQREEKLWRSYVAQCAWRMDRFLGGKELPTYDSMLKPRETRSAEQIKNQILTKLRGGG